MNKPAWQVLTAVTLLGILAITAGCTGTGDELPAVSEEGMKRVENTRVDALYVNPDADFSEFKRVAIADVDVSFRRNWLKDQNQSRRPLTRRVSQDDANRIRTVVADSFRRIFTEELEKAGYTVVDPAASGNGAVGQKCWWRSWNQCTAGSFGHASLLLPLKLLLDTPLYHIYLRFG